METSSIKPLAYQQAVPHEHPSLSSLQGWLKRLFDFSSALVGGLLIAPILLLIALVIKLDSKGPVLYRQLRVGVNGEEFWMYKFRSMHVGAEALQAELMAYNEMDGPLFKMKDDPRVTRIGRVLRRTSLDEFPQLINVLRGEMSLVGPRPPLPSEVAEFEPWQKEKFDVRPGMTGLWQISGRNSLSGFNQMIELDLAYIRNWDFSLDIIILFKTVTVVLKGLGAH